MPDAVEGRSCGWKGIGLSDRGASSNSFGCGGFGDLGYVERNNDGLRTSAMIVKVEGEGDEEEGEGVSLIV